MLGPLLLIVFFGCVALLLGFSRWLARHFRSVYERYLCFIMRPRSIRVVLEVIK